MTTTTTTTFTTAPALARGRVLLVGIGGLGAPAARALAEAGVGTLGLVDPDLVEVSNLHRQPLYEDEDVGTPKVEAAAARLHALVPGIALETRRARCDAGDAALFRRFDVVLDGTDSIVSKFDLSDAAVAAGVPLVHAGVLGFQAQVMTVVPHQSACYRCVFEDAPPVGDVPSCTEAGVLGPVPALAAALQAAEALRILLGLRPLYADRLQVLDLLAGRWRTVALAPNPRCPTCADARRVERSASP